MLSNLKLIFVFSSWTWLHHFTLWGSIIVFFACMAVFSSSTIFAIGGADYYQLLFYLFANPRFWLTLVLTCVCAVVLDLFVEAVTRVFNPNVIDVCREAERSKKSLSLVLGPIVAPVGEELEKAASLTNSPAPTLVPESSLKPSLQSSSAASTRDVKVDEKQALLSEKKIYDVEQKGPISLETKSSEDLKALSIATHPIPTTTTTLPSGHVRGESISSTIRADRTRSMPVAYTGFSFNYTPKVFFFLFLSCFSLLLSDFCGLFCITKFTPLLQVHTFSFGQNLAGSNTSKLATHTSMPLTSTTIVEEIPKHRSTGSI
jgi:hypothetical protein